MIDIREPEEIEKAVKRYGAKTILITRPQKYNPNPLWRYINSADKNVAEYKYSFGINNGGSLENFKDEVADFFYSVLSPLLRHRLEGKVIAVDFDNTIAKTRYPEIIELIPETIDFLYKAKENGATIILWTCREGMVLEDAVRWCKMNNVPIDLINQNAPDRTEFWGNDSRKIGADLYIDDKSFSLWHDRRNENDLINQLLEEDNK